MFMLWRCLMSPTIVYVHGVGPQAPPDQLKRKGARHLLETIRTYYPNQAEMNLWDGLKEEHFRHLPIYDWAERLQDSVPYLKDYFDHPEEDGYWHQLNVRRQADQVSVPIFHLASWYDGFLEGGLHYFSAIRQHGMTAEARAGQRLMVGPWPHLYPYDAPSSQVGELDLGPEAMVRVGDMAIRWFNYWLKDIDSGVAEEKPVNIFVMGDNSWRQEDDWTLARAKYTPFYLHSGGRANTLNGDGILSRISPENEERSDSFVYDPDDPVPTRGGSQLGPNPTGPCDQHRFSGSKLRDRSHISFNWLPSQEVLNLNLPEACTVSLRGNELLQARNCKARDTAIEPSTHDFADDFAPCGWHRDDQLGYAMLFDDSLDFA